MLERQHGFHFARNSAARLQISPKRVLCQASAVRTCSLQIKTVVPRTWSTSCPHHQHHYFHHNQQQQPQQQRTRLPTWGSANSFTPVLIQWNGKNASRVAAAAASANGSLQPHWQSHIPHGLRLYWPIIQRAMITLLMLAIVRMGYFIALPGVDLGSLPVNTAATEGERFMQALYGQSKELPASIFDLGISPHINASIIVAVLLIIPKELASFRWLDRLREARKEGKGGEALINDRISWLAFGLGLYMSCLRAFELLPFALYAKGFVTATMVALMAGSFMIHHCANTITNSGIGNGSTLVICMGIISEYAETIHNVLAALETSALSLWTLAAVVAGYLGLVLFTVFLSSSEVRLPIVQYSNAPKQQPGSSSSGSRGELFISARSMLDKKAAERGQQGAYFPLLLNSSGVMPMIFASAAFYGLLPRAAELLGLSGLSAAILQLHASPWGLVVYGLLVFLMEFLPFGSVNPPEVSEYFTTINVGIKGVAPGYATTRFLKQKVRQCKFWGGLALGGLAVSAHLFDQLCLNLVGTTLATTSLVIIVGAVLQTARQVESLMEGPQLQKGLDQERAIIQSLSGL